MMGKLCLNMLLLYKIIEKNQSTFTCEYGCDDGAICIIVRGKENGLLLQEQYGVFTRIGLLSIPYK